MKKKYVLNTLFFSMLLLTMNNSLADDTQKNTPYGDIYDKGIAAYKNQDYVNALKYLFSYRLVNEGKLVEHDEFASKLDAAIEHSESKLREQIKLANRMESSEKEKKFRAAGF